MPAGAGDMLHDKHPALVLEPVPPLAPEPPQRPPPSADPAHLAVYKAYMAIYDAVALERGRVQSLNAKRRKRHNEILFKRGQTSNNIRIDEPGNKAAKLQAVLGTASQPCRHSETASHLLNSDGPGSRVKVEELPPMPAGAHVKVEELPPMPPDARTRIEHAS